jgi:hypothetical protein
MRTHQRAGVAIGLLLTALSFGAGAQSGRYTGKLIIDPSSSHYFVYDRDRDGNGQRDPAYLAGVGGPEGFLYESANRKQTIINRLKRSSSINQPANGIYFHSTRAFGGDGSSFETPFLIDSDPNSGLDPAKLDDWLGYLKQLDKAGIVMWFTLFDDHSLPYGCDFNAQYDSYARGIVAKFKDLKHLIWVTQEEYRWTTTGCTTSQNDDRQSQLAQSIRAVDSVHPIATHHMNGDVMRFPNDPNIRVFGQQSGADSPEEMHDSSGLQGWGNWVYVMAEDHPWHLNLIDDELDNGAGRTLMRRSNWATAMSGGHVLMYNSFECGNSGSLCNDGPTDSDPTDDMLDDLRRLRLFMEATPFNRMAPLFDNRSNNDFTLTNTRLDATKYILSNTAAAQFILYGDVNTSRLGMRGMPAGSYLLKWFDPATGAKATQSATVGADGRGSFVKPAGIGVEAVVYARKR